MQNFGRINETYKNIFLDSILSKDDKGKKLFKEYVKALKSSSVLASQYRIYNNIENKVETDMTKSSMYVSESIALLKKLGVANIVSENSRLIKTLTSNGYEIPTDDYDHKELHENVNTLVMCKKTSKNLDALLESAYYINNFINENTQPVENPNKGKFYNNKVVGEMMIEKFNKKYSGKLSEGEKLIFKSVVSGDESERKELYSSTIRECIDLVDGQLIECNIEEKDKLLRVKDKLLRFKYNEENYVSEMSKIVKLKGTLI